MIRGGQREEASVRSSPAVQILGSAEERITARMCGWELGMASNSAPYAFQNLEARTLT